MRQQNTKNEEDKIIKMIWGTQGLTAEKAGRPFCCTIGGVNFENRAAFILRIMSQFTDL